MVALRSYRQVRRGRMRQAVRGAGLDALLRPDDENVIALPGSGRTGARPDLFCVPTEMLRDELHRRQGHEAEHSSSKAAGA